MSDVQARRPQFETDAVVSFVRERYQLHPLASPLPSERDQNFRLRCDSGQFTLKISRIDEPRSLLSGQNDLLRCLAGARGRFAFAEPVSDIEGNEIGEMDGPLGTHLVRLLSWVDGVPLAGVSPQPLALVREIGELMGTVAAALPESDSRLAGQALAWDMGRAEALVHERCGRIAARDSRPDVRHAAEAPLQDLRPRRTRRRARRAPPLPGPAASSTPTGSSRAAGARALPRAFGLFPFPPPASGPPAQAAWPGRADPRAFGS